MAKIFRKTRNPYVLCAVTHSLTLRKQIFIAEKPFFIAKKPFFKSRIALFLKQNMRGSVPIWIITICA